MTDSAEPHLPSENAPPANYGAAATAPGGASAFAEPAGAASYPGTPYPGQPAAYNGMPAPGAAPPDYGTGAAAPQQGPYNENYGQPPAGPPQGYAANGYPATATPNGYPTAGQPGAANAAPMPADPYANAGSPGGANYGSGAPLADNQPMPQGNVYDVNSGTYQPNDAGAAGGYRTADSRSGPTDANPQPEQTAADRYTAPSQTSDAPPEAPSSMGEGYRPGSTGYNPGQTGYSPPGVSQYQMPAKPNVASAPRKDPYYRPGGTTDFAPTAGAQTPSASASQDRYNTPPIGHGQADPYAQ